jgi:hypothetical protein
LLLLLLLLLWLLICTAVLGRRAWLAMSPVQVMWRHCPYLRTEGQLR